MIRLLRHHVISKVIACTFLILFLQSVFAPTITRALTNGPHQPEYMAYSQSGATDMVNLLTGDFSFQLPIVDVPGPEGGFSLPLTYDAGIGLEQESSWIGLGWSMNSGAIARNVVEFPDDANGESFQIRRMDDDVARGWKGNIPIVGQMGWDSNVGHYGRISILGLIGASYKNGNITGGNVIGIDFNKSGVKPDVVRFISAVATIASFGATSAATSGAGTAVAIAKDVAVSAVIETASTLAFGVNAPNFNLGTGWTLSQRNEKHGLYTEYWLWLDDTRYEDMYGVLNLDNMPTHEVSRSYTGVSVEGNGDYAPSYLDEVDEFNDTGSASDMHYYFDGINYGESNSPSSLATDNFSVMGPGISGLIKPYRLDMGSLSMPRDMSNRHLRLAPVKFNDYKVQFKYAGNNTNSYIEHVGQDASGNSDIDALNFGVDYSLEESGSCWEGGYGDDAQYQYEYDMRYSFTDPLLSYPRSEVESNRYGLTDKKLSLGKNVEWYSNEELAAGVAGFMDYLTPSERTQIQVGSSSPGTNTIGGYKVTREDGKTYYYTLPVYEWDNYTKMWDKTETDKITEISRPDPFPSTWLLTGITGSDFVDRGTAGEFDEADWGYWVSFDYGKFSSAYDWRIPYEGEMLSSEGDRLSYTSGKREQYYLDKISTRTHTALFVKDLKKDGRGAGSSPASSLLLDEVIVLKNTDLTALDISKSASGREASYNLPSAGDSFSRVVDTNDISSSARSALDEKALSKVVLNYDYTLCNAATNSFDINSSGVKNNVNSIGKLTLNRISIYGPNNVKTIPDFIFDYAYNPNYNQNKWDGWGHYNNSGSASDHDSHRASLTDRHGYAWSLNRITTPLGNTVEIEYERDTYSSIAGNQLTSTTTSSYHVLPDSDWYDGVSVTSVAGLVVGDRVNFSGTIIHACSSTEQNKVLPPDGGGDDGDGGGSGSTNISTNFSYNFTIDAINGSSVVFAGSSPPPPCSGGTLVSVEGTITKTATSNVTKKGGDIRVSSIEVGDGSGEKYKTRYIYTKNGQASGLTSGVIAQEPDYIKTESTDYDFYNYFDFPVTPVIYGKVTVLNGNLTSDSDYTSKVQYEFETPDKNMIERASEVIDHADFVDHTEHYEDDHGVIQGCKDTRNTILLLSNVLDINTSSIGSIVSVKNYDGNNHLLSTTDFNYTDRLTDQQQEYRNMGVYTEGTFMFEKLGSGEKIYKTAKTTKRYHPYFLESVVTTDHNGLVATKENVQWDFITGEILREKSTNALGVTTLSETIPAYKKYPEMGPKAEDANNHHMLAQDAATYTYRLNASGNKIGLIGASVQTWSNDWQTYRKPDGNGIYQDKGNGHPRWRKKAAFVWEGEQSDLNPDGTLEFNDEADRFDFAAASNPGWKYGGEVLRYDNYSMPLQSKDLNDLHISIKTDISSKKKVLEASNAKYTEVVYSGVENDHKTVASKTYVDSEVRINGTGQISNAKSHTGVNSISVATAGQKGFYYVMKSGEFETDRNYRVSVWVHTTHADKAQLYYIVGSSISAPAPSIHQSGNWKRYEIIVPSSALSNNNFEVGVRKNPSAGSGTVYVDDFRFQPLDAGMTSYIYDDHDRLTYVLDNENMFTEYEYNSKGQVVRTYIETFRHGRVKASENENYYMNMSQ